MQLKTSGSGQRELMSGSLMSVMTGAGYTVSSAGAAVTLAFTTLDSGLAYNIGIVHCAYDADPTGGAVQITDYANTVLWKMPITKSGPCEFDLDKALANIHTGIKVGMAAGGGAVVAHLNVNPKKAGNVI